MATVMIDYDKYTYMQYHIQNLEKKIASYESAAEYSKMQESNRRMRRYYEREISRLQKELQKAIADLKKIRDMWFDVFEDMLKEQEKREAGYQRKLEAEQEKTRKALEKVEKLENELKEQMRATVEERAEKIETREKLDGLKAQMGQGFENSSIPSSKDMFRGKVTNNREETTRHPGGQIGHKGHRRKSYSELKVIETIVLPVADEIADNPDYRLTKNVKIHKKVDFVDGQLVSIDYVAHVYRNKKTDTRYQPPFPANMELEVNYGEGIKAIVFLMKNLLNASEENIILFLHWITDGVLSLSRGFVNGINDEFCAKSKEEQEALFKTLLGSEILYTDMTSTRMNGDLKNVVVCSDKEHVLYYYRENKGHKGIKGTPVEFFSGILVHDHDKTMYHYGGKHQSCNAHHLRYLKAAMEQEPDLTWHKKMRELLQEMDHTRNTQGRILSPEQIEDFKRRYLEILDLADQEYNDNPPSDYFRKGYNLSVELREYMEAVLCFLDNPKVDFTNNTAELCCRKVKRHIVIAGTFRGYTEKSAEDYCSAMSVMETWRIQGDDVLARIREVFARRRPPGQKKEQTTTGNEAAA